MSLLDRFKDSSENYLPVNPSVTQFSELIMEGRAVSRYCLHAIPAVVGRLSIQAPMIIFVEGS